MTLFMLQMDRSLGEFEAGEFVVVDPDTAPCRGDVVICQLPDAPSSVYFSELWTAEVGHVIGRVVTFAEQEARERDGMVPWECCDRLPHECRCDEAFRVNTCCALPDSECRCWDEGGAEWM